jgi:hypothetical protein
MLLISPVLPATQGDCKREWLRADRYKMEAGMPNFSPAFV